MNLVTGAATLVGSTGVGNLIGLMYVPTVCPPPPPACPGDLNGDNQVDIADLTQLLANFGTASGATPEDGDMDEDGDVDITDLATLLARFGTVC